MKVMNHHLEQVEDQARDIEEAVKRNDKEMLDYERELKDRENKLKLDEMKCELARAKRIAGGYKKSKKVIYEDEYGATHVVEDGSCSEDDYTPIDIEDLVADNAVLLARVDAVLGSDAPESEKSEAADTLTSTMIDELYGRCVAQKKRDAYVDSKKKVLYPLGGK